MASIQFKKSRTGKKSYYVVVSFSGKHKWIKAGTQKEAEILKRRIESLENSQRVEKLEWFPNQREPMIYFRNMLTM
jgi:hypothetical protein